MAHLPFLKALATRRIPIKRSKTNPQCILVLSEMYKITQLEKIKNTKSRVLQRFPPKRYFPPLNWTKKAEESLLGSADAGCGRGHPVIQLRFPLSSAGCTLLSGARPTISTPKSEETTRPSRPLLLRHTITQRELILLCGRRRDAGVRAGWEALYALRSERAVPKGTGRKASGKERAPLLCRLRLRGSDCGRSCCVHQ